MKPDILAHLGISYSSPYGILLINLHETALFQMSS